LAIPTQCAAGRTGNTSRTFPTRCVSTVRKPTRISTNDRQHGLRNAADLHPNTLDYIPALATHWQISPDKLTFRYRLDPNARWADGQPVVADDVVATWTLMMDQGLQDPANALVFGKFEKPVAESKYIVRVKSKDLNWRNFLYFSASLPLFPAHVLKNVNGASYVKDYNFKLLPGTGPYEVRDADVIKGKSVTIRRRNGYWAEKIRRNVGENNFDAMSEVIVAIRSSP
jgi:microcin C transport system substrate-binding protein